MLRIPYVVMIIFIASIDCFNNPGVLLTIPLPFKLPNLSIKTPQPLDDLIINELQLTNVQLITIKQEATINQLDIKITNTSLRIYFNWDYKQDHGQGYFQQKDMQFILNYTLSKDIKNRFVININHVKKHNGHIDIHLGGNVKQTVIIEVTKLILNKGSIIFWSFVEKTLVNAIQGVFEPLFKDLKLTCLQDENCLYINTTLVTQPTFYNKKIIVQINGLPYFTKNPSQGYLNPQDSLIIEQNISQINIQIHSSLFQRIITQILKNNPIKKQISSYEISSIAQIDSQMLTNVFPGMIEYCNQPRNVIFGIEVIDVRLQFTQFQGSKIIAKVNGSIKTQQLHKSSAPKYPYLDYFSASADLSLNLNFQKYSMSTNINHINVREITVLDETKIDMNEFYSNLGALFEVAKLAINGQLNKKTVALVYNDYRISIKQSFKKSVLDLYVNLYNDS